MRLWHYQLLPYLPDAQFKGQLRELVAIMRDWRDKGRTNHILINRVMEYPRGDLFGYFSDYVGEYLWRYDFEIPSCYNEFCAFRGASEVPVRPYEGWHNRQYLRVCMANLYEKHAFGRGSSRITDEDWQKLCAGYYAITGEAYKV